MRCENSYGALHLVENLRGMRFFYKSSGALHLYLQQAQSAARFVGKNNTREIEGAAPQECYQGKVSINKNIGNTHITNGCYRVPPVDWSIGEAVGLLVKFAQGEKVSPRVVRENAELSKGFQGWSWSGRCRFFSY